MSSSNNLRRIRGTTKPFLLALAESGAGHTFRMVVDSREAPDDDSTEVMDMTGVLDASNLTVEFTPSAGEANTAPGLYHFQVQRTRVSDSQVDYPADGVLEIVQSIPK